MLHTMVESAEHTCTQSQLQATYDAIENGHRIAVQTNRLRIDCGIVTNKNNGTLYIDFHNSAQNRIDTAVIARHDIRKLHLYA